MMHSFSAKTAAEGGDPSRRYTGSITVVPKYAGSVANRPKFTGAVTNEPKFEGTIGIYD